MASSPAGPSTSDLANRSRIINRIEREAGVPRLADILSDRLAPTDLQSLLLEVYARRAKKRDPKALLDDHVSNRFTRPSASDPTRLLAWDRVAFSTLPSVFQAVELSPVCSLGTGSVLAPYCLRLVRTGPFRPYEILRLLPTRRTCSRLNARFDAANRRISPRAMQLRFI